MGQPLIVDKDASVVKATDVPYSAQFYATYSDGSRRSAAALLAVVFDLVRPRSLVDVGCGVGTWAAVALELGASEVLGIDGDYVDRSQLQIPHTCFMPWDLEKPLRLERRFDLAMSLEVAEHLPAACAESFVESLVRLAPVVLFSAAVPGQGGHHHVNEQWPAYWAELFARHNFKAVDCVRPQVWSDERVEFWYRQNTILYARHDYMSQHPELRPIGTGGQPLSLVHPGLLAKCRKAQEPANWGLRRVIAQIPRLLVASVRRRLGEAIRSMDRGAR
jgi:SAM-dependent methyltransferase